MPLGARMVSVGPVIVSVLDLQVFAPWAGVLVAVLASVLAGRVKCIHVGSQLEGMAVYAGLAGEILPYTVHQRNGQVTPGCLIRRLCMRRNRMNVV